MDLSELPADLAKQLSCIVTRAVDNHAAPCPAIEEAYEAFRPIIADAVRAEPDLLKQMIDGLVRGVVQECVYQRRTANTFSAKRRAGAFGRGARLNVAGSEAVAEDNRSILDEWYIGKTRLGDLCGGDLLRLAADEDSSADGHLMNAALLRHLAKRVKGENRVRDCVRAATVESFVRRWRQDHPEPEAA